MREKLLRAQNLERSLQELRRNGVYKHKKYDLSDADITLLFSVWFGPADGIKPSAIAKRLKITLPAVTHKMNNLQTLGYLDRRDSVKDQRVTYVLLTEKGKSFVESVKDEYYDNILNLIDRLGERDTNTLFRLLEKINELGKL